MPLSERREAAPCEPTRSVCPIASALDLLGDRWTLLVVRDLLLRGRHRFADLLAGGESISTNILADRLARLEACGIVERRRYQQHPPRDEYHATAMGRDLLPVLRELVRWGNRHIPGTFQPPPGVLDDPAPPPADAQPQR